jgi:ankyrin repeat protein
MAYELNETKIQTQIVTYRFDGKEIILQRDGRNVDPAEYKATILIRDGQSVFFEFKVEEPRHQYLDQIVTFELPDAPSSKQNERGSGTILGSRLDTNIEQMDRILLKRHIDKVIKGEASINDMFYKNQYTPLLIALYLNDFNLVERFIKLGANVNYSVNLRTPLFYAITVLDNVQPKILNLLMKKGAKEKLNEPSNLFNGYTPLHGAVIYNEGDQMIQTVEYLLKNGADVNVKSNGHRATAIEYAKFSGAPQEVIDLLVKYGAVNPECPSKQDLSKLIGTDTPILKAIRERRLIHAGLLAKCHRELEEFDGINYENIIGDTALKLAIDLPNVPWKDDLLEKLMKGGVNVNYVDRYGFTPLYYAISKGKIEDVKFLIDNGANPKVAIKDHGTALDFAIKLEKPEIINLLMTELAHRRFRNKKIEIAKRQTRKTLPTKPKPNYSFVKRKTKRVI